MYLPLLYILHKVTRYWREYCINAVTTSMYVYIYYEYLFISLYMQSDCFTLGSLRNFLWVVALTFMMSAWWCCLLILVWLRLELIKSPAWFVLYQLVCFCGSQRRNNVKNKGGYFNLDGPFLLVHLFVCSVLYSFI